MRESYRTFVKCFYRWTAVLSVCALLIFAQDNTQPQGDLVGYAHARINYFKLELHKKLLQLTFYKTEGEKKWLPSITSRQLEIGNEPAIAGCVVRKEDSSEVIFAITSRKVLSFLRNFTLTPIYGFPQDRNFIFLQGFEYGKDIWMLSHHISKKNIHKIRLFEYISGKLHLNQVIKLPEHSLVSFCKFGYRIFVASASSNTEFTRFILYQWTGTELDEVFSTNLDMSCAAMALWMVDKALYVALSFPAKRQLTIRNYVDHANTMRPIQFLDIESHVVQHFKDGGSHYLVCGTTYSIVLYWWSGSIFLQQQEIFLNRKVIDITVHSLNIKVVIAAVFIDEVEFFVQDASALYVKAGSVLLNSPKSVLLWESGSFLYMMPLSNAANPLVTYELNLTFVVSTVSDLDTRLEECLLTLDKTIDEREEVITYISSGLEKVWLPSFQYPPVSWYIYGSIMSQTNTTIRSMRLDAKTKSPSTSDLGMLYRELLATTGEIKTEVANSIMKSNIQNVQSILNFKTLTVKTINEKMDLSLHSTINEVPTDRLYFTLRNKGSQNITSKVTVSEARCKKAEVKFLNSREVEDFVLLGKTSQVLTGNFTFVDVTAGNVLVNSNTINLINIEDMVLGFKPKKIKELKIFKSFIAKSISTSGSINKIDIRNKKNIVYLNSSNFNRLLQFTSDFVVNGDIRILSNDSLVSDLCSRSVKKDESGLIGGYKNFQLVTIDGNLNISGLLNNFTTSNLMNLNEDQSIYNSVSFSDTTYFFNIETDYVNGVDISSQAFKSFGNDTIKGIKTFNQTLKVANITAEEGITIDSYDPSEEVSKIVTRTTSDTVWISYEAITVGNIIVKNYSEIYENSEHFPLLNVLGNVWLKSTEQNISYMKAINMSVNELLVSRVNGIPLDDLVLVNDETNITAAKEFKDDVNIETLIIKEGKILNITQLWNHKPGIKILNSVTMDDTLLESNLNVTGTINGIDSFLLANENQNVTGEIKFDTVQLQELYADDLKFQLLNNTNFTIYLENSILLSKSVERKLLNKNFTYVAGAAMKSNGLLNGIDIQNVATLNTAQNITVPFEFRDSVSFKKLEVKRIFDDIRLQDLVYTDSVQHVSNKQFNGTVTTSRLHISGCMSDVNITDLELKAFNRSENTTAEKIMIFKSRVEVIALQLAENRTIDEVNFNDIIRLNDTVKLESFNSSSISAENVTLSGLINRCNLTSIFENALYRRKSEQNVTARPHVETLVIDGDLLLENINTVWMKDIFSHLNQSSGYIFDEELFFENISVKTINIQDFVNNLTINSIFDDAVRRSISQVINGTKIFKEISSRTAVIASLESNITCEVNVSRMHQLSINRTAGNKTLQQQSLFSISAENITVQGTLNKLQLPAEVVLVNETGFMFRDTFINGTINISADLQVLGNIDGVSLGTFLGSRFTLRGNKEYNVTLSLVQDAYIKGATTVNGTINGLRIADIAKTANQINQTLNGSVNFTQSDLTVDGSVKGLLLQERIDKVLLSSKNETLNDTVQFLSLNASSLVCNEINGISIVNLYNSTHNVTHFIDDKLYNFTSYINDNIDLLRSKMDSTNHLLPIFSYFEFHQSLKFDSVERFLPVYEYGVNGENYERQVAQMVVWLKRNYSDCRQTRSLFADVLQNGTLKEVKRIHGKIFHFSLRTERDGVVAFMLQAEFSPRCSEKRIIVNTILSSGDEITNSFESPANATLEEALLIEIHEIFLLTAYSREGSVERIFLHQYDSENRNWSFHQKFHEQNFTSLDWTFVELDYGPSSFYQQPDFYLAVTGDRNNPGIYVYEWDVDLDEFALKLNITTSASSSAMWVSTENLLFLLLSKEMTRVHKDYAWKNVYSEPIEVYSLEEEELFLNHTISVRGVRSLEMFTIAGEIYILASSPHMETLYVIQYRGYNGFEVIQEMSCPGITSATVFTFGNHLYLAVSSSTGHSRILKAAIRGENLGLDLFFNL